MKPVETRDTNFTYKLPGGTSANDLPCEKGTVSGNPFVRSTWDFDEDEADLFKSTEGALFLQVFGHGTEVAVYQRGDKQRPLALEVVSNDSQGTLYVVGAAGIAREEIVEAGLIDLVIYEVPIPPVAMWVQPLGEVEPEVVDAEAVAAPPRTRYMLVIDAAPEVELPVLRQAIEFAFRGPSVSLIDMEVLPPIGDPENLDHPDTKGA